MTERYDPPEEKIAEVVAKYTPRQLSIAYLRAQKRAQSAELAFGLMTDVNDMTLGVATGNIKDCEKALESTKRRLRTQTQTGEARGT